VASVEVAASVVWESEDGCAELADVESGAGALVGWDSVEVFASVEDEESDDPPVDPLLVGSTVNLHFLTSSIAG
jgi:hypothetical protein